MSVYPGFKKHEVKASILVRHQMFKNWFWLANLIAIVSALGGCGNDPAALMQRAEERALKGEYAAAIIDLKSALQKDPNNGVMRYRLGRLYNLTFDGASAEKELRKAAELGVVEGGKVAMELGRSLILQKKQKEILSSVIPSPAFEPAVLASSHVIRAHAHLTLGQIEDAKTERTLAENLDRENLDVLLLGARFRAGEKDLPGALQIVEMVLERDPRNFEAWTYKVDLLSAQKKWDAALEAYEKLLAVNPRHLDALVGRTSMLLSLNKLDDAQKDVDSLKKLYARHPVTGYLQGRVHFTRGKYRDALESAQTVLKRDPDYDYARLLTGMAHLALGSVSQAEQELKQYIAKNPQNLYARRVLATAQVELNQGAKALETLEPVLRSDLKHAAVLALAGDAYSRIGEYSKAAEWFDRAAALSPENPLIYSKQAQIRFAAGQVDMAVADLERASKLNDDITHADTALVLAHVARRDFVKAMEAIARMEKKAPKSPHPANLRGLIMLEKQDTVEATRNFEAALKLDPKFVPATINLAKLDFAAGKIEQARKRFEELIRLDEKNLQALLSFAEMEESLARRSEAKALLERASKISPSSLEPKIRLARLAVLSNDQQRARALADEAFATNPDHPAAIELLGSVQIWSGDHNSGVSTLTRLTSLFPRSPEAFYKVAAAQLAAKRTKDAETNLRKALELRTDFPAAAHLLLQVYLGDGRSKDALDITRKIQHDAPKSPLGYNLEGDYWIAQQKPQQAVAPYRTAMELRPNGAGAAKLFHARAGAGERKQAISELNQWVEKHPRDWVARGALVDGLMKDRDFKAAIPHLERMLNEGPVNPSALNNLAWAYFNVKDARALATAETAHKYLPNDVAVQDTLGWVLVEQGQVERGTKLLEKAAKAAPDNPEIRFHWAAGLAKAGKKDLARQELSSLLATRQKFAQAAEAEQLLATLR